MSILDGSVAYEFELQTSYYFNMKKRGKDNKDNEIIISNNPVQFVI